MHKFLCKCSINFSGKSEQLLGHMVTGCLVFKKLTNSFPDWLYHFAFPTVMFDPVSSLSYALGGVTISFLLAI